MGGCFDVTVAQYLRVLKRPFHISADLSDRFQQVFGSVCGRSDLTVGFEEFVHVCQELQQPVEFVLGGAALQHGEEQHGGLALQPLQRESTGGRRTAISQLNQRGQTD